MADICSTGTLIGAVIGTFVVSSVVASAIVLTIIIYHRKQGRRAPAISIQQAKTISAIGENISTTAVQESTTVYFNHETNQSAAGVDSSSSISSNLQVSGVVDANRCPHPIDLHPQPPAVRRRRHKLPRTHKTFAVNDRLSKDDEVFDVSLQGRPFEGLGFNIIGNMTDGLFVSRVFNRGPAYESGCIRPGDRIEQLTVSTRAMVYEDALTILSYASSYPVRLKLRRCPSSPSSPSMNVDHRDSSGGIELSPEPRPPIDSLRLTSTADDETLEVIRSSNGPSRPDRLIRGDLYGRTLPAAVMITRPYGSRRSLFRSQSFSLGTPGKVRIGEEENSDVGEENGEASFEAARSTTALDEVTAVEFRLMQRQLEILNNSEMAAKRLRGRHGPRTTKQVGGLRRQLHHPSSASDADYATSGEEDELRHAQDQSLSPRHCRSSSSSRQGTESTMNKLESQLPTSEPRCSDVKENKEAETIDDIIQRECSNSRGRSSWLQSSTWRYFRHSSADDCGIAEIKSRGDGDDDDDEITNVPKWPPRRRRRGVIVDDVSSVSSNVVVTSEPEYSDVEVFERHLSSMSEADSRRCTVDSGSDVKTISMQSLQISCHWPREPSAIGDVNLGNLVRSGGLSNLHVACAEEPLAADLWSLEESSSPDTEMYQTRVDPGSEQFSPVDGAVPPHHISATAAGIVADDDDDGADNLKLSSLDLIKDLNNANESDGQKIVDTM